MLRAVWRPLAATTAVLGTSAYLYRAYASTPASQRSFDIPVRLKDADGKRTMSTRTVPLLSIADVEDRLNANAVAHNTPRPDGVVWRHTTAHLASNNPIEDANAFAIVERDPLPGAPDGDLLFFAVMDGHGGPHTSRLLSKTLIPAVALQLSRLMEDPNTFLPKSSMLDTLKSYAFAKTIAPVPYDADPKYVSMAIQTAFAMVDSEIVNAPLRLLAEHLGNSSSKANVPDLSQNPMALPSMLPALSGSCALLAVLDTARRDLYVACTGDCRAVAGIWEENPDGKSTWRVEVLSEDQTGRNPKELSRIQSEHPKDEAPYVIQRGRVLGGLEPSRAFGDARYKWSAELQKLLERVFLVGNNANMRNTPPGLKTPPYVTSQPVITHRKLSFLPLAPSTTSGADTQSSSKLRFIVLATDGLWDELSSSEVVALVGGHLAGLKGSVSKAELPNLVPTSLSSDPSSQTVEGKDMDRRQAQGGAWAFIDDNVSTHLIRNAFGGADQNKLQKLLSIPAPLSRSHRDDVTVTVVWWEDGREGQKQETFTVKKDNAKAKL